MSILLTIYPPPYPRSTPWLQHPELGEPCLSQPDRAGETTRVCTAPGGNSLPGEETLLLLLLLYCVLLLSLLPLFLLLLIPFFLLLPSSSYFSSIRPFCRSFPSSFIHLSFMTTLRSPLTLLYLLVQVTLFSLIIRTNTPPPSFFSLFFSPSSLFLLTIASCLLSSMY